MNNRELDNTEFYLDLEDGKQVHGALYCDYATFRTIYQLQTRAAVRNQFNSQIAMLKIRGILDEVMDKQERREIVINLQQMICESLRRDDVVTSLGETQFLILLNHIDKNDCEKVLHRIVNNINQSAKESFNYHTKIQALEPLSVKM